MDTHSINVVSHESILVKAVTPPTFSTICVHSCWQLYNIYVSDFCLTKKQKEHEIELLVRSFF